MASLPNDYSNLTMLEKLQKIMLEETKDVRFIFDVNGDNDIDSDATSTSKNAESDSNDCEDSRIVKIAAHKKLLTASSPVFNAMFNGPLKESGDIKIMDASPDAFREFLQIFYNDQIELTEFHLDEVMNLIEKYDVADGWPIVDKFFQESLTVADILWGLHLATKFQRGNLIAHCASVIERNKAKVFDMIAIDDNCKPKFRSNTNNGPMTDADLANIFPSIWRSFVQKPSTVSVKLEQSMGMISDLDQIEGISFAPNCTVVLTHLTYPAIYTHNRHGQFKSRPYNAVVTVGGIERSHKIPWNGGTITLSPPIRFLPINYNYNYNEWYTIETRIILNFQSTPFIEVYKTPLDAGDQDLQIAFRSTYYNCVAAMNFIRYEYDN